MGERTTPPDHPCKQRHKEEAYDSLTILYNNTNSYNAGFIPTFTGIQGGKEPMIDPYFVIRSLALVSKRKEKESILTGKTGLELFWGVVKYAYHPQYNFFLKKIDRPQEAAFHPEGTLTDGEMTAYGLMFTLLDSLRARVFTGNAAKEEVEKFLQTQPANVANVLWLILQRDLECGVTSTTANKIIPGLVPEFKVQLAKEADLSEEMEFPLFVEEKYDGVRIIAYVRPNVEPEFFTREGNSLYFPTLAQEVKKLPPGFIYDGEITGQDRKSVAGLVNKFLKGTAKEHGDKTFEFHIFDCLPIDSFDQRISDEIFSQRRSRLEQIFEALKPALLDTAPCVRLVSSYALGDVAQIQAMYDVVVERGGEGLILKAPHSLYAFKRDNNWLKMKETNEVELVVTGWTPGNEGKRHGKVGSIECKDASGTLKVDVGSGFSDEVLEDITQLAGCGQLIGKIVTVKYNSVIDKKDSDISSLFLPRFKEIRVDKSTPDTYNNGRFITTESA